MAIPAFRMMGGLFFFLELSTLFLLMVSGLYKAVCKRSSQQKCKSRSSVTATTTTCWSYVGKHLTPRGGSDFEGVGGIKGGNPKNPKI